MVIRLWMYKTAAENADRFEEFESKVGLEMMLSQPGCQSAELFRMLPDQKNEPGIAEYSIISRWESWQLLETAFNSKNWLDEVALFLAQGFGEGNGIIKHYEQVNS